MKSYIHQTYMQFLSKLIFCEQNYNYYHKNQFCEQNYNYYHKKHLFATGL